MSLFLPLTYDKIWRGSTLLPRFTLTTPVNKSPSELLYRLVTPASWTSGWRRKTVSTSSIGHICRKTGANKWWFSLSADAHTRFQMLVNVEFDDVLKCRLPIGLCRTCTRLSDRWRRTNSRPCSSRHRPSCTSRPRRMNLLFFSHRWNDRSYSTWNQHGFLPPNSDRRICPFLNSQSENSTFVLETFTFACKFTSKTYTIQ